MQFSVGYQLKNDDKLINAVIENRDKISEVYFSFGDIPNGRGKISDQCEIPYLAVKKQMEDLKRLKGIKMNLLLNGNCYGKYALARSFYNKLGDTVDYLKGEIDLQSVTTTSPLIARFIKENFSLHVRASVNMGIGSVEGMEYVQDLFDSFYLAREYNRDIKRIKAIKAWCDKHGKGLYGLANSGCLKNCSAHTFHDNLVAHESESAEMDNAYKFEGQCKAFLQNEGNRKNWLRYMTFIRPEDVSLYEGLFDGIKLATRVNRDPEKIITSYVKGSYSGAVSALLEPDHTALFYPEIIENKKISGMERVLNCNKNCTECTLCAEIQKEATVIL
jgi:hypothetical protein